MALKPTIYKTRIALSDLDRDYYDSLNLTLALHPSETLERMAVRILAYCLHAPASPVFTRGLSTIEEPDLWVHTLDDRISLWIEVGEPANDRVKKASRLAQNVFVYAFNSKSTTWWQQNGDKLKQLDVTIIQFAWPEVEQFSAMLTRTTDLAITLSGETVFVNGDDKHCELQWRTLSSGGQPR
jgi:uncharacterized protein YaeQ